MAEVVGGIFLFVLGTVVMFTVWTYWPDTRRWPTQRLEAVVALTVLLAAASAALLIWNPL